MVKASITRTVKFAQKGAPGDPGADGKRGMLPYPAGVYGLSISYVCTNNVSPYVLLGETYYVMNKVGTWVGQNKASNINTPQKDYAVNGSNATWIPFEKYKAIYVELLMADFAKLASAVFYGEYMFSQQGVDANGNATSNYQGFGTSAFTPNLQLDFKKGRIDANLCFLKASLYTPFNLLQPNSNAIYADFSTGFNLDIGRLLSTPTVECILYLPKAVSYSGAVCYLYNSCGAYIRSGAPCTVKISNSGQFLNLYSSGGTNANAIKIGAGKMLRLRAVESRDMDGTAGAIYWYIENPEDCTATGYAPNL